MYTESDIKKFFLRMEPEEVYTPAGITLTKYNYTFKFPEQIINKQGMVLGDEITIHMPKEDKEEAIKEAFKEYKKAIS